MVDPILTKSGRLRKAYLPAVYLDTSVLIDYYLAEGLEGPDKDPFPRRTDTQAGVERVLVELLRSDKRVSQVAKIREKLVCGGSAATVVTSPLALLEFAEWSAETGFRELAGYHAGASLIKRSGKKEIGEYLKKLLAMRNEEIAKKGKSSPYTTSLQSIMGDTWPNWSFMAAHGIPGIRLVDIRNFALPVDGALQEPSALAYLQLGAGDIFHVLFALHLGCEYIASFDSDFVRARSIVQNEMGLRLLTNPKEILSVL